jgi:hypothetical protein
MDNDRKRALRLQYKDNPPEMGVLQVRNSRTGQVFVFGATNLEGKVNGARAQLASGSFMDKGFQADYNTAPDDVEFTVLEVVKRDKSPGYDYKTDLKLLAKKWADSTRAGG